MISLYPVIAKQLALPLGKEFKFKPKHGGVYPAQYRGIADKTEESLRDMVVYGLIMLYMVKKHKEWLAQVKGEDDE